MGSAQQPCVTTPFLERVSKGDIEAYRELAEATACEMDWYNNIYAAKYKDALETQFKKSGISPLGKAATAYNLAYANCWGYPFGRMDKNGHISKQGKKDFKKAQEFFHYALETLQKQRESAAGTDEAGMINLYLGKLLKLATHYKLHDINDYPKYWKFVMDNRNNYGNYFKLAAEAGIPEGMYEYALYFLKKKDAKSAAGWLEKAAAYGHVEATAKLATLYYYGSESVDSTLIMKPDYEKAFEWANRVVGISPDGAKIYGFCRYYGHGCKQDYNEALTFLKYSIIPETCDELKDLERYYILSVLYNKGWGGAPDQDKSQQYWKVVKDSAPNNERNYIFAKAYYDGLICGQDYPAALSFLQKCVDRHKAYPPACILLSRCYRFGRGVDADEKLADYYSKKASFYRDGAITDDWLNHGL